MLSAGLLAVGAALALAGAVIASDPPKGIPGELIPGIPEVAEQVAAQQQPAPRPAQQEFVVGRMRLDRQLLVGDEPAPWAPEKLRGIAADPQVTALVRSLGADGFAERDAATARLRSPAVPDVQVWIHLAGAAGPLPYEAQARLLEIARSRIVDAPHGALGIQMAGRFAEADGVVVTALIPNMPAKKVLKPGDRIVELDGHPIQVSQQLSAIIQGKRPGDRVHAVVMRGERDELGRVKGGPDGRPAEKRIEFELEVGSRADLEKFGDGGGMDMPVSDSAREHQAQRLADAFRVPVRTVPSVRVAGEPIDVDAHPDIVQLKEQLARPEGLGVGVGIRAVLRARLTALEAAARAPGLTDDERKWFEAVAERYRELIPEELRPEAPAPGGG
jgi:hypothetical protein